MKNNKWLIIELNDIGEACSFAELNNVLQDMLGFDIDYFIPMHSEKIGSYTSTSVLFKGYVFVRDTIDSRKKLENLSDFRIFSKILENDNKFQTVNSRTIGVLKRKLKNASRKKLKPGTKVRVLAGMLENLSGEVISLEDEGKEVMLRIKRLSREIIAPVPVTNIVVVERDEL